jgi:peptide deformylase
MSDVIKINTEDAVKNINTTIQQEKVFQLVSENHPILRQTIPEFDFSNPPVNPSEFASTLVETCKLHRGIGLSANQCGFSHRVFVMGSDDNFVAFFNPELINVSKEEVHMVEGCLSFPFLALRITRPAEIGVRYQDFNGEWKGITLSGISARCFQHELDHMNGVVYTSKVKPLALQSGIQKRNKIMKKLRLR